MSTKTRDQPEWPTCKGSQIFYPELREEEVTVRTTGAAAWTLLTTVEEPEAAAALSLPLLTTRLVVVVRPPVDERELETVLWMEDTGTGIRFHSRSIKSMGQLQLIVQCVSVCKLWSDSATWSFFPDKAVSLIQ